MNISSSMVHIQHFPYQRSSVIATIQQQQRHRHTIEDIEEDDFVSTDDTDRNYDDVVDTVDATNENVNQKSDNDDRHHEIVWIRRLGGITDDCQG